MAEIHRTGAPVSRIVPLRTEHASCVPTAPPNVRRHLLGPRYASSMASPVQTLINRSGVHNPT